MEAASQYCTYPSWATEAHLQVGYSNSQIKNYTSQPALQLLWLNSTPRDAKGQTVWNTLDVCLKGVDSVNWLQHDSDAFCSILGHKVTLKMEFMMEQNHIRILRE